MAGHEKIVNDKERKRQSRKTHIRKRVSGTPERPRLSVFRSSKHIYAQAVDDVSGNVLATASDLEPTCKASIDDSESKSKTARAHIVGKAIAAKLLAKQVTMVVFDRNGFLYHGRVAEVAKGARDAGLVF